MDVDRRAQAYAKQFCPVFIGRYINAARAGRPDIIPEPIREPIVAYVQGRPSRSKVDANAWMTDLLYQYRARSGNDLPLPLDLGQGGKAAARANGAKAARVTLGLINVVSAILRMARFR